jgi:hypothetical protein
MDSVRPVFKKLLIAAIAIYVIGTAVIVSDLSRRVGELEHSIDHLTGKCAERQ